MRILEKPLAEYPFFVKIILWAQKKKYGEGRRVFKMAPLHHHFELCGWTEPKIVTRFYIIAILMMILSLATFKVR